MKIKFLLPIIFLGLAHCTRKEDGKSKVSFTAPLSSKSFTKSSRLIRNSKAQFSQSADPSEVIEDINCYVILISAPENAPTGNYCTDSNSDILINPLRRSPGLPAGGSFEIELDAGSNTEFVLVGFNLSDESKCANIGSPESDDKIDYAYLLADEFQDIAAGVPNTVELDPYFDSTELVKDCKGPMFGNHYNQPPTVNPNLPGKLVINNISAGWQHTCITTLNGKVKCWGENGYGQLGLGDTNTRGILNNSMGNNLPFVDLGNDDGSPVYAIQVEAGINHTCALTNTGKIKCWGNNTNGQLGIGNTSVHGSTPGSMGDNLPFVNSGEFFTSVSVAEKHTCALASTGSAYCWGYNGWGQFGNNSNTNSNVPLIVPSYTFTQISAGGSSTCGVTTGNIAYCWGRNMGQLGDGTNTDRWVPTAVVGLGSDIIKIVTSGYSSTYHTCALDGSHQIFCWGMNGSGQLGDNTSTTHNTAVLVSGSQNYDDVKLGSGQFTCGHDLSTNQWNCWGNNTYGRNGMQLNSGSTLVPTPITDAATATAKIFPGGNHSCALFNSTDLRCFGTDIYGQLGQASGSSNDLGGTANSLANIPLIDLGIY